MERTRISDKSRRSTQTHVLNIFPSFFSGVMASSVMPLAGVMIRQSFRNIGISRFFNMHTSSCYQCEVLGPPPNKTNFFDLMQQPKMFAIDTKNLAKRFKQLQAQFHPDRYSSRSEQELKHSENWSSLVNEAYGTLLDPMSRALYLLELFGNPLLEGEQPVLDPEFLMDIMELNEEIEEAQCKEDVIDFRDKIRTELDRLHEELKVEFAEENVNSAKIVVAKMQYHHNLRYKIKDKEIELGIVD